MCQFPYSDCFANFYAALLFLLLLQCAVSGKQNGPATNTTAPMEFPKNESQYPFKDNSTILQELASRTSDSEVNDLLHGGRFANVTNVTQPVEEVAKTPAELKNMTIERKLDVELIEDGQNTEDERKSNLTRLKSKGAHGKVPVVQGQLAAILAGVLVVLAAFGYVGMLYWRKFLERRYGNRQMLINEEDFSDPNDMKHFSLG